MQQHRRCVRADAEVCWQTRYTHTNKYLRVKSRRHAFLCHTPRKSRPHRILTSLMCMCHSQIWTKRYVSVVRVFVVSVGLSSCVCKQNVSRVLFLCERVLAHMCDLCVCVCVCVPAHANDACVEQYSLSSKLHRPRALLT